MKRNKATKCTTKCEHNDSHRTQITFRLIKLLVDFINYTDQYLPSVWELFPWRQKSSTSARLHSMTDENMKKGLTEYTEITRSQSFEIFGKWRNNVSKTEGVRNVSCSRWVESTKCYRAKAWTEWVGIYFRVHWHRLKDYGPSHHHISQWRSGAITTDNNGSNFWMKALETK